MVTQDYGVPGCELAQFVDQPALEQYIAAEIAAGRLHTNLALHYPTPVDWQCGNASI